MRARSLDAAFNTQSGELLAETASRRTSAEFVVLPTGIATRQPRGKEIHVTAHNLSSQEAERLRTFLLDRQTVQLHSNPTYSSSPNQVDYGSVGSNAP